MSLASWMTDTGLCRCFRVKAPGCLYGDYPCKAPNADEVVVAKRAVMMAEEGLRLAVQNQRSRGATWAQIGNSLGVSRQAAQERFG